MSAPAVTAAPRVRPGRTRVRTLLRTPAGAVGAVLTLLLGLTAVAGLLGVLPHDPAAQDVAVSLQGPGAAHWFGTDQFGRDVFARVASGLGNSLRVGFVSVACSAVLGILAGVLAGYYGGVLDRCVGALTNVLFAFPSLLLALALTVALGRTWLTVSIAIAVVYLPIFVRVARGPVLTLRSVDYVTAATALGEPRLATLFTHVLPNMRATVVVQVALTLSWSILTEASLSFLGFGTPPPAASLGAMVYDAQTLVTIAPWMLVFPGLALVAFVVGLNLLGDGLRTALDPTAGGSR